MPEYRKLIEIVAETLEVPIQYISAKSAFVEDLGADSLEIEQIMLRAMELFDTEISDADVSEIETVGDAFYLFHPAV